MRIGKREGINVNVQEMIDKLQMIPDKSLLVGTWYNGEVRYNVTIKESVDSGEDGFKPKTNTKFILIL